MRMSSVSLHPCSLGLAQSDPDCAVGHPSKIPWCSFRGPFPLILPNYLLKVKIIGIVQLPHQVARRVHLENSRERLTGLTEIAIECFRKPRNQTTTEAPAGVLGRCDSGRRGRTVVVHDECRRQVRPIPILVCSGWRCHAAARELLCDHD